MRISVRFTHGNKEFLEIALGHLQLTGLETLLRGLHLGADVIEHTCQPVVHLTAKTVPFFQDRQKWQGITDRHCYVGSTLTLACRVGRCILRVILKMLVFVLPLLHPKESDLLEHIYLAFLSRAITANTTMGMRIPAMLESYGAY